MFSRLLVVTSIATLLLALAVDVSAKTVGIKIFGRVNVAGAISLSTCANEVGCGVWSPDNVIGPCPCAVTRSFDSGVIAGRVAEALADAIASDVGCMSASVSAIRIGPVILFDMPNDMYVYLRADETENCGGQGASWLKIEECAVHRVLNGIDCDETGAHDGGLSFFQCFTLPGPMESPNGGPWRFDSRRHQRFQTDAQTRLLEINAIDDVPSGPGSEVLIRIEGRTLGGTPTISTNLLWGANNNMFRVQSVLIPDNTDIVRLTFRQDYCGSGCPRNPDADRNAHVDWLQVSGIRIEGEDFDRTGAPPLGCGPDILCDPLPGAAVPLVTCGNEGDWVEYDIYRIVAVAERTWGSIKAVYRD